MRKTANPNINTRKYWNSIYGTPEKREQYAVQGTDPAHAHMSDAAIKPTKRFEKTLEFIKDGDKVLDMGCGVGVMTSLIKSTYPNAEVWGTDISDQAIADNKLANPDITYHHGYIGSQDFLPQDYFDVVFCGETLEHMDDPNDVFTDALRALKPGGTLIITTPLEDAIRSEEHTFLFGYDDVEKLYKDNGFETPRFVYLPDMEHLLVIYAVGKKL